MLSALEKEQKGGWGVWARGMKFEIQCSELASLKINRVEGNTEMS